MKYYCAYCGKRIVEPHDIFVREEPELPAIRAELAEANREIVRLTDKVNALKNGAVID